MLEFIMPGRHMPLRYKAWVAGVVAAGLGATFAVGVWWGGERFRRWHESGDCASQLRQIRDAIVMYKMQHRAYPPNLTALVDEAMLGKEILVCPAIRRAKGSPGQEGTDLEPSYVYLPPTGGRKRDVVWERDDHHGFGYVWAIGEDGVLYERRPNCENDSAHMGPLP
jgi:hypothetical protein